MTIEKIKDKDDGRRIIAALLEKTQSGKIEWKRAEFGYTTKIKVSGAELVITFNCIANKPYIFCVCQPFGKCVIGINQSELNQISEANELAECLEDLLSIDEIKAVDLLLAINNFDIMDK